MLWTPGRRSRNKELAYAGSFLSRAWRWRRKDHAVLWHFVSGLQEYVSSMDSPRELNVLHLGACQAAQERPEVPPPTPIPQRSSSSQRLSEEATTHEHEGLVGNRMLNSMTAHLQPTVSSWQPREHTKQEMPMCFRDIRVSNQWWRPIKV